MGLNINLHLIPNSIGCIYKLLWVFEALIFSLYIPLLCFESLDRTFVVLCYVYRSVLLPRHANMASASRDAAVVHALALAHRINSDAVAKNIFHFLYEHIVQYMIHYGFICQGYGLRDLQLQAIARHDTVTASKQWTNAR
jgi:hypothetical protein